jgi:hypothetical protein
VCHKISVQYTAVSHIAECRPDTSHSGRARLGQVIHKKGIVERISEPLSRGLLGPLRAVFVTLEHMKQTGPSKTY